jgi:Domain of unknown function (DUF6891)
MLEKVFTELYERGVMLFLDVDSYCTNTADVNILKKRNEFLQCFDEPIAKGYVFTFNTSLEKLYKEIDEDSCAIISYGFESDTDDKAHDVGKSFVEILNDNGFEIKWTESVKDKKTVTIVITEDDVPSMKVNNDPYLLTLCSEEVPSNGDDYGLEEENLSTLIQLIPSPNKEVAVPLTSGSDVKRADYKCTVCSKTYKQKKSFEKHIFKHQ